LLPKLNDDDDDLQFPARSPTHTQRQVARCFLHVAGVDEPLGQQLSLLGDIALPA